jgi:hypothetical protein
MHACRCAKAGPENLKATIEAASQVVRHVDKATGGADVLPVLRNMDLPALRAWHENILSKALQGGGFSDAGARVRCPAAACLLPAHQERLVRQTGSLPNQAGYLQGSLQRQYSSTLGSVHILLSFWMCFWAARTVLGYSLPTNWFLMDTRAAAPGDGKPLSLCACMQKS